MNILLDEKCESIRKGKIPPDTTICAAGADFKSDTCQGDSGGPLFTDSNGKQVLLGIVSFGEECGKQIEQNDGTVVMKPAVYTKIAAFKPYIDEVLQKIGVKAPQTPVQ